MMLKREIGDIGENEATKYLKKNKYKILERNFRKKYGEIDIIAKKGENIAFVEVKTRKNDAFGRASEFVDWKKQERIKKTAFSYISEKELQGDFSFDIVEVYLEGKKVKEINSLTFYYIFYYCV